MSSILREVFGEYLKHRLDPMSARREAVGSLSKHDTPDVRRLVAKLDDPGINALMYKADEVMSTESLTMVSSVDAELVWEELGYDLGRADDAEIRLWRSELEGFLSQYSGGRLDILWDLSWSLCLWPQNRFKLVHLAVYTSLMGDKPDSLNCPYQFILTSERKRRIKQRERRIYAAAKRGDLVALVQLGLGQDIAERAVRKVRGLLEASDEPAI